MVYIKRSPRIHLEIPEQYVIFSNLYRSDHDLPIGRINNLVQAGFMMTIPNFYQPKCDHAKVGVHNSLISPIFDIRVGALHLSERPSLEVKLDMEFMEG